MGKDEETDIAVECLALVFLFDLKIICRAERHHYSTFDVRCWMLDVHLLICSMFDVRRSSFKTIPYGINVTCERLQNNLALMGVVGGLGIFQLKIPVHIISPGLGNRPDANGDHKEGHPVGLYRFF